MYWLSKDTIFIFLIMIFILSVFFVPPTDSYGDDLSIVPMYFFSYMSGQIISSSKITKWHYLVIFLVPILMGILSGNYIYVYVLIPIILFLFLGKIPNMASNNLFQTIGIRSSGIYVWHAPIILPLSSMIIVKLLGTLPYVIFPIMILTILLSYIVSAIVSRFEYLKIWRF